jgi:hypothetical protein
MAAVGQQLHADADPEEGRATTAHSLGHGLDQAVACGQRLHAGAERPDARQHQAVGTGYELRIRSGTDFPRLLQRAGCRPQRLLRGGKVAGTVVDQGDGAHEAQSTPLVDAA